MRRPTAAARKAGLMMTMIDRIYLFHRDEIGGVVALKDIFDPDSDECLRRMVKGIRHYCNDDNALYLLAEDLCEAQRFAHENGFITAEMASQGKVFLLLKTAEGELLWNNPYDKDSQSSMQQLLADIREYGSDDKAVFVFARDREAAHSQAEEKGFFRSAAQ